MFENYEKYFFYEILVLIKSKRLNISFGPLTYFSFSIWSLNSKVSQFGPINLMSFTILVLPVSILQNLLTPFHMSFKIGDQRLDLKSTQAYGGLTTYDNF